MILDIIIRIVNSLVSLINELGYLGIFLGMTIESSFFPFPSEIILIPAGVLVAEGSMNFWIVCLLGILGSIVGALINFFLAFFLGRKVVDKAVSKYGKFLFLNSEKLERVDYFFKKKGEITTFVGRLIPGVRQIISLPAGFSKMNLWKFSLFTILGAGIWSFILVYAGYLAGNNLLWLKENVNIVVIAIAVIILSCFFVRIILSKNNKNKIKNS